MGILEWTLIIGGTAFVGLCLLVLVVVLGLKFSRPKSKAAPAIQVAAASSAPSFLETLKGGTAGAHAKIDAACEDHAVSETLKHLFLATKHLVKDETPPAASAPVPNPPAAP